MNVEENVWMGNSRCQKDRRQGECDHTGGFPWGEESYAYRPQLTWCKEKRTMCSFTFNKSEQEPVRMTKERKRWVKRPSEENLSTQEKREFPGRRSGKPGQMLHTGGETGGPSGEWMYNMRAAQSFPGMGEASLVPRAERTAQGGQGGSGKHRLPPRCLDNSRGQQSRLAYHRVSAHPINREEPNFSKM